MDCDGTTNGYDLKLTKEITSKVNIPVIASGGAGKLEDFYDVFTQAQADAALAASLFHYGKLSVKQVKEYLNKRGVMVRL
jgi:cyclase